MSNSNKQVIAALHAENRKLRAAIKDLICWAGEPAEGPEWATAQAKARNRSMCEHAIQNACDCFPADYNGFHEVLSYN